MIPSKIPSSFLTPGAMSEFDFTSGSLALNDNGKRLVGIGEMLASGTAAANVPVQVFSQPDADAKFGQGSMAALMVGAAIRQTALSGGNTAIYICPIVEAAGGVKAVETLTITGPATEANTMNLSIAGRLVQVGVSNGDAQNTIATAVKAACDRLKSILPCVVTVAANVVTFTFATKGVNGNDVIYLVLSKAAGTTAVFAQTVAGAGAADITPALAALYDQDYLGRAISNHTTADIATLILEAASLWGYQQKHYDYFFMGENGSLSTAETLQAAANDFHILIHSLRQSGSLPGELAMMLGVMALSRDNPNPNLDGEPCAAYPPPSNVAYSASEIEVAIEAGLCPSVPDGVFCKLIILVTSQISFNSAPFDNLRDFASSRTSSYLAKQIEQNYAIKFKQAVGDATFLDNVRDMVVDLQRLAEAAGYIRDVDTFLTQTKAVWAFVNSSRRVAISNPHRVAGPVHQAAILNTMYL